MKIKSGNTELYTTLKIIMPGMAGHAVEKRNDQLKQEFYPVLKLVRNKSPEPEDQQKFYQQQKKVFPLLKSHNHNKIPAAKF